MNYLTKSVQAIGGVLGLFVGENYVHPYDDALQSDSGIYLIW